MRKREEWKGKDVCVKRKDYDMERERHVWRKKGLWDGTRKTYVKKERIMTWKRKEIYEGRKDYEMERERHAWRKKELWNGKGKDMSEERKDYEMEKERRVKKRKDYEMERKRYELGREKKILLKEKWFPCIMYCVSYIVYCVCTGFLEPDVRSSVVWL